jgi:hypothetical protein
MERIILIREGRSNILGRILEGLTVFRDWGSAHGPSKDGYLVSNGTAIPAIIVVVIVVVVKTLLAITCTELLDDGNVT